MKILTTVKHVVDVELNIRIRDGIINEEGLQYVMNAWDENAVEATVVLKENNSAETTLLCIGGDESTVTIRKAFAMGIESGIQIKDPLLKMADSSALAKVLKKVYEKGAYDLVITGKQAQDTDNGQTGLMMAEFANLPCVSNVTSIEVLDEKKLKLTRQGDEGKEVIELELPAVITVNDSINEPRLPALKGIMMAKKKTIEILDLAGLGLSADEAGINQLKTEIISFNEPESRKAGQKFEGDLAEITAKVVDLLVNEAKVL